MSIDYNLVASLYDAYVDTDFDVPFFLAEVRKVAGPVLELTSGTGRLSIPLIEAGVDLTCVDSAQGMLDVLLGKLSAKGLTAIVRCADVCSLELPSTFDLAILPFQSFMEIVGESSQRAALASVFRALRPGARFICTMHNPEVRRRQVDASLRIVGRFPLEDGSLVVSGFEQGGDPVVSRLQFFEFFSHDGRLKWKLSLPMEFELIERERFEQLVRDTGFIVERLYGDYERSEFCAQTSPVMVWVLRRPA